MNAISSSSAMGSLASHCHQTPHALRPQSGPVTRPISPNSTAISAAASAIRSARGLVRNRWMRLATPQMPIAVNIWRTIHPLTSVVPTLPATMGGPFWFCVAAYMLLLVVLLMLRVNLGKRQAALDELYLAYED